MTTSLRVLVAAEEPLLREILETSLVHEGHAVIDGGSSRQYLLDHARSDHPDVCLMGLAFPDGNGIDVIGELAALPEAPKVLVLDADGRPETIRRALAAGATGFVHKGRGLPTLLEGLTRVVAGGRVVAGEVSAVPSNESSAERHLREQAAHLTPRELECLELLTYGMDTTAMARQLRISTTTVRSHVQAVLTKLGAHSKVEAASLALRHGLVRHAC